MNQEITVKYFGRDSQGFHRITRKGMLLAELPEQNFQRKIFNNLPPIAEVKTSEKPSKNLKEQSELAKF